jgi:hypothetical protein
LELKQKIFARFAMKTRASLRGTCPPGTPSGGDICPGGVRWWLLVAAGVRWWLLVAAGVRWWLLVSAGVRWCPLVSAGVRWCPLVSFLTMEERHQEARKM